MLMLLFVALISIVLGMGLPTTANYIVVSSLMASVVVELGAPGVEAALLGCHVGFGWPSGVGLQRPVHPLVLPILLRAARFDPVRHDPELDPAYAQTAEPADGLGRERDPVVGAN